MYTFKSLIEKLDEAQLNIGSGRKDRSFSPKYNNVLFMAGSAGAGKSFIIDNVLGFKGKLIDIDEFKSIIAAQRIKSLEGKEYTRPNVVGDEHSVETYKLDKTWDDRFIRWQEKENKEREIMKDPKKPRREVRHLEDLKIWEPSEYKTDENGNYILDADGNKIETSESRARRKEDNNLLHEFSRHERLSSEFLSPFLKHQKTRTIKDNYIVNMSFSGFSFINDVYEAIYKGGYDPKNIHLAYVVTDIETALDNNEGRLRKVGYSILERSANKSKEAVDEILKKLSSSYYNNTSGFSDRKGNWHSVREAIDGEIWIVFNNRSDTIVTTETKTFNGKTYTVKNLEGYTAICVKEKGKPALSKEEVKELTVKEYTTLSDGTRISKDVSAYDKLKTYQHSWYK